MEELREEKTESRHSELLGVRNDGKEHSLHWVRVEMVVESTPQRGG